MPKKKVTTTVEETEETKESAYEEIHGKSMDQIAKEPVKEVETEATPEAPKEPEKQEEVIEKVEEVKTPEIDPEQLKKDIAEETTQRIVNALKGDTAEEIKTNKDEYQQWAEDFATKNNRPPEYTDAFEFLEDRAVQRLEAKQEEAKKQKEQEVQKAQAAEQEFAQRFLKEVDEEVLELERAGKLTRIKDPNDDRVDKDGIPLEPGKRDRHFLFNAMTATNAQRVKDGQHPIESVTRIFTNHYKPPTRQPAGAGTAIINNRSGSTQDDQEINYFKDVRGGFKGMYDKVFKR